jgi:hypothetical protein
LYAVRRFGASVPASNHRTGLACNSESAFLYSGSSGDN